MCPAQPLTSTGPTFDATCVTLSLQGENRVRAKRGHRDWAVLAAQQVGFSQGSGHSHEPGSELGDGTQGGKWPRWVTRAAPWAHPRAQGAGVSPSQLHCASQPAPGDPWLRSHVGILQQEERLRRPGQCPQLCTTQHHPASASITQCPPALLCITKHHPVPPIIVLHHPVPPRIAPAAACINQCRLALCQHHLGIAQYHPSITQHCPSLPCSITSALPSATQHHSSMPLCHCSTSHSRCSAGRQGHGWHWAAPRRPRRSQRGSRAGHGVGRRPGAAGGPRAPAPWGGLGRAPAAGGTQAGLAQSHTGTASTTGTSPTSHLVPTTLQNPHWRRRKDMGR